MTASMVYVTCADADEARRLAATVIDERLAACGNIIDGMASCYRWQGEVKVDAETVLILKTRRDLVARLDERLKGLHSYELPCVVALPIEGGNQAFIDWISENTIDRK